MAEARVREFRVVDDVTGRDRANLPGALKGATLVFNLASPVAVFVRVEAWLDAEHQWRAVEEFPAGIYGPGAHQVRVPLHIDQDGPGKHDGPAKHSVELSVQILDPHTAARDRGTDGIELYRRHFSVEK